MTNKLAKTWDVNIQFINIKREIRVRIKFKNE